MSLHPDGHLLASGHYPHGVLLWNLAGRRSIVLRGQKGFSLNVNFTPDGRLVSTSDEGVVRLWPLWADPAGQVRKLRSRPDELVGVSLDIAPEGRFAVVVDRAVGHVIVLPLDGSKSTVHEAIDVVPEESQVIPPLGRGRDITEHGNRVSSFTLDPTGTILVTGDRAGLVRVGPLAGGEPHLLYGHSQLVTNVAVSPDGQWIAPASDDETIRLWPMPDVSKAPLHTLPYEELLTRLRSFTNLRVVRDEGSETGCRVEAGPFPGWALMPEW